MIISVIRQLLRGEKPSLTAGEQMWDFLYSKDCARALRLLGNKGMDGKVYCIGSGRMRPLWEYITMIRDCINPSLPLGFGEIPYAQKQVMHLDVDISELIEDTDWRPQYTFIEGIKETIDWCKINKVILKPEEEICDSG